MKKKTTGLVLMGPHPWARPGVGAPSPAHWERSLPTEPSWEQPEEASWAQLPMGSECPWGFRKGRGCAIGVPVMGGGPNAQLPTACGEGEVWVSLLGPLPLPKPQISGRTWTNTCMDWFYIHFYLFVAAYYELLSDTLKHLLSVTLYCISLHPY